MSVDFNNVLTRQHSGEEDVVGEGDKATFPQSIKYTVLIGKLLPLLGNLLLIEVRMGEKGKLYSNISIDAAQTFHHLHRHQV